MNQIYPSKPWTMEALFSLVLLWRFAPLEICTFEDSLFWRFVHLAIYTFGDLSFERFRPLEICSIRNFLSRIFAPLTIYSFDNLLFWSFTLLAICILAYFLHSGSPLHLCILALSDISIKIENCGLVRSLWLRVLMMLAVANYDRHLSQTLNKGGTFQSSAPVNSPIHLQLGMNGPVDIVVYMAKIFPAA